MRKLTLLVIAFCLAQITLTGQDHYGYDPNYRLLHSESHVKDKNYYLLTLFEKIPEVSAVLASDPVMSSIHQQQLARIEASLTKCDTTISCWVNALTLSEEEQNNIGERLAKLAKQEGPIKKMVNEHMRSSGLFIKHAAHEDDTFLKAAWEEACKGLEYLYDVYAFGKKLRYHLIDSASFDVQSFRYKRLIMELGFIIAEDSEKMTMPHEPGLSFGLWLLDINNRDEAARHEPMALLDNNAAEEYIPRINWSDYPYAVILAPGAGPDRYDVPLSAFGKLRLKIVADRFYQGLAPLIIVSGGYVHPFQTPFSEAVEMKKALMEIYGIPEQAIMIDPHARHTTTNFRNAARLLFRYGIPTDKMSVVTTTVGQSMYITNPQWKFEERCSRELGYLPYQLFERLSPHDVEFKATILSLHADPLDPLDP